MKVTTTFTMTRDELNALRDAGVALVNGLPNFGPLENFKEKSIQVLGLEADIDIKVSNKLAYTAYALRIVDHVKFECIASISEEITVTGAETLTELSKIIAPIANGFIAAASLYGPIADKAMERFAELKANKGNTEITYSKNVGVLDVKE